MITFQYDAQVPSSWQWQGGVQVALPWSSAIDLSYVGNRGYNQRLKVPGTYKLFCALHPGSMTQTVKVVPKKKPKRR